jgi:small-conductance mechanosensitive channel
VVEIEGDTGKVIRLTSRATILLSFDGNHIRIPNATVFKSRIVNYSTNHERRFSFEIGVSSDADLADVRRMTEETVSGLPFVLNEPAPMSWIERIGDGAIFLTVTGWIHQEETSLVRAKGEALRLTKARIESAGIEVPDTTYRVQLLGATAPATEPARPVPPKPAPGAPAPTQVEAADVTDMSEAGLDKLVDAERNDPDAPDLLTDAAPKE